MRIPVLALALCVACFAQAQALKPFFNVDGNGLWAEGYDPVAYLVQGKALKGSTQIIATYKGATFRFANTAHRELFKKTPEHYLPQYGGWCAYAMGANGEKVEVDPETFKVKDGKVFLFYNAFFNNTLTTWNKNEAQLYRSAEQHWATFQHSK